MFPQTQTSHQFAPQEYVLTSRVSTSGWSIVFDPNLANSYGMSPAQVALQAGNLVEFQKITESPQFDPNRMGMLGVFFEICRCESVDAYSKIRAYFNTRFLSNFSYSESTRQWERKSIDH